MHRITRLGLVVFAVLAAGSVALAQQHGMDKNGMGKKGEVEFTTETHVGSALLKPGHYQFQHHLIDTQHYLIVRSQATSSLRGGQHYAGATGEEIARVPCRLLSSDKKQRDTALYWRQNADGTRTVTQINIRGEKDGHVITLEPQS